MKTIIHSNGSKWAGEEPDSIEKLIEMLNTYTIEERFFNKYTEKIDRRKVYKNLCPISMTTSNFYDDEIGMTVFFGNFEEYSHVFRIATNDKELIEKLSKAIKENKGWIKYYEKNLVSL